MKKHLLWILLLFSTPIFAGDFVNLFFEKYVSEKRPLNDYNANGEMLSVLIADSCDNTFKEAVKDLTSFRILETGIEKDSEYYFTKIKKLIKSSSKEGYNQIVSIDNQDSKIILILKKLDENNQDLVMISLEKNTKFTIINLTGKINFGSLSNLTKTLGQSELGDRLDKSFRRTNEKSNDK